MPFPDLLSLGTRAPRASELADARVVSVRTPWPPEEAKEDNTVVIVFAESSRASPCPRRLRRPPGSAATIFRQLSGHRAPFSGDPEVTLDLCPLDRDPTAPVLSLPESVRAS